MPPGSAGNHRTSLSDEESSKAATNNIHTSPTNSMTTATQTIHHHPFPATQFSSGRRPTLPPLGQLDTIPYRSDTGPLVSPSVFGASQCSISSSPDRSQISSHVRRSMSSHHESSHGHSLPEITQFRSSGWNTHQRQPTHEQTSNPLKRPFGPAAPAQDRYLSQHPPHTVSPAYTDPGSSPQSQTYSQAHFSARTSVSGPPIMASRTQSFNAPTNPAAYHQQAPSQSLDTQILQSRPSNIHRFSLHLRQQPRAARAGPDGKDRRAIDPPPVLQLMLDDFDASSEDDMDEIRSSYFVVHCALVSPNTPTRDMSTLASQNDDGSVEIQRLLLGTAVSSPFFCADDPDPENMPENPKSASSTKDEAPPSPTNRFIQTRNPAPSETDKGKSRSVQTPGSFFIFPDLSVRKAGEYRLEFSLMKLENEAFAQGGRLPVICRITSQVFRVVNAKDFDQVQPSTELVKGLLDRGAGFPLKLKKGTREIASGGRRKADSNSVESDDEEREVDDNEDDEED